MTHIILWDIINSQVQNLPSIKGSTDEIIRVISTDKAKVLHVLKGHLFPITALGLCKNGKGQTDAKGNLIYTLKCKLLPTALYT